MGRRVLFPIAAVVLGLTIILAITEGLLRAGSWAVSGHRSGNVGHPVDGEVRITCLGESMTWGEWPAMLESMLNERSSGATYRVINRGMVGARTDDIAERIAGWLEEDRPHLVIAMLGVNDEGNVLVYPRVGARPWLVENLKTARLFDLLWRSAFPEDAMVASADTAPEPEAHLSEQAHLRLGELSEQMTAAERGFLTSEMIRIQREIIVTDPGTPAYHLGGLKGLVLHHDAPERVGTFIAEVVGAAPGELDVDRRLRLITDWATRSGDGFAGLRLSASVARHANDLELEQSILDEACRDPDLAPMASLRRAAFAYRWEDPRHVRHYLLQASEGLPADYQWSLLLGRVSFLFEVHDLAAVHFENALSHRPDLSISHEMVIRGRLATSLELAGDPTGASDARRHRDELELARFREFTRYHYREIVNAAIAHGAAVIAMQYPTLSADSLRKLLDYREDVVYVENRSNFDAALAALPYHDIFTDSFAGGFGHLGERGNLLVAENVAGALEQPPLDRVIAR